MVSKILVNMFLSGSHESLCCRVWNTRTYFPPQLLTLRKFIFFLSSFFWLVLLWKMGGENSSFPFPLKESMSHTIPPSLACLIKSLRLQAKCAKNLISLFGTNASPNPMLTMDIKAIISPKGFWDDGQFPVLVTLVLPSAQLQHGITMEILQLFYTHEPAVNDDNNQKRRETSII